MVVDEKVECLIQTTESGYISRLERIVHTGIDLSQVFHILSIQVRGGKRGCVAFEKCKYRHIFLIPIGINRGHLGTSIGAIFHPTFCFQSPDGLSNRNRANTQLASKDIDHKAVSWHIRTIKDTLTNKAVSLLL